MPSTIPPGATDLAGFALAHAVWSVSDTTPSELLCPLALIDGPDRRSLTRFEAASQEEAIRAAKEAMAELTRQGVAWAFAREGALRTAKGPTGRDAVVVDVWAPGLSRPLKIVQPFQRATAGRSFSIGAAMLVIEGALAPEPLARTTLADVRAAVDSHPRVKDLWPQWEAASGREP